MGAGWSAAVGVAPGFVGGSPGLHACGPGRKSRSQPDRPPPGLGGGRLCAEGGQKVIESSALTFVGWRGW